MAQDERLQRLIEAWSKLSETKKQELFQMAAFAGFRSDAPLLSNDDNQRSTQQDEA
jgi:hypothetical protein